MCIILVDEVRPPRGHELRYIAGYTSSDDSRLPEGHELRCAGCVPCEMAEWP